MCKALAKYVQLLEEDWDKFIPSVLFAYRTMQHKTIQYDPFRLTYGCVAIMPLDLLLEQQNKIIKEVDEEAIINRVCQIIDTLEPTLEIARRNIVRAQQKLEDREVKKNLVFKKGDLVLKFKYTKEKESKFQPRWRELYTIYKVYRNGAYKLQSVDGKILKNSTNGNDLRKYNIRELPEVEVVIE